jgi:PAS domain S-box-containing protein
MPAARRSRALSGLFPLQRFCMQTQTNGDISLPSVARLLDALNCGALVLDRAGTIVHANSRLAQMLRRSPTELVGRRIIDLYPDEEARQHIRSNLAHFEEQREEEFYLPLPDGTKLPMISSARPLPGHGDFSDYRIVTMIDIASQKQAESRMRTQYEHIVQMSDTVLQQALELKNHNRLLEQRVRQRTADLHAANLDAIYMLAVASEAKDGETGRHVRRIQHFARALSQRIGMTETEAESVGHSALLHDVGKIHVPDAILSKPGPLNDTERQTMREHTLAGEHILSTRPFFELARQIARSHHENFDGTGYPDGLAGEAIPIAARVTRVVDVYDALSTRRVYKPAWPRAQAIGILREGRGKAFDPQATAAFLEMLRDGEIDRILCELGQDAPPAPPATA